MASSTPRSVDEYMQSLSPEMQVILAPIRDTVFEAAPNAVEGISYQIPTYKQA